MEDKVKKKVLPRGFLTSKGNPTQHAVTACFVYLTNLPDGWDLCTMNWESVLKVREYFKVDYGFDVMIFWGLQLNCAKSKSSSGRYVAMSKAINEARGWIGKGYVLSHVTL